MKSTSGLHSYLLAGALAVSSSETESRTANRELVPQRRRHDIGGGCAVALHRRDNRPRVHDRDAVAHAEDLRELGRNHDDGHAAFSEVLHQLVYLGLGS